MQALRKFGVVFVAILGVILIAALVNSLHPKKPDTDVSAKERSR